MQGWVIIAIVAIVVWGIVQTQRRRGSGETEERQAERQALTEAQRERDELRERVQVLERIITDENTPAAQKTKQLAQEIESLRQGDAPRQTQTKEDLSE